MIVSGWLVTTKSSFSNHQEVSLIWWIVRPAFSTPASAGRPAWVAISISRRSSGRPPPRRTVTKWRSSGSLPQRPTAIPWRANILNPPIRSAGWIGACDITINWRRTSSINGPSFVSLSNL